jgi:hypothetical protein
MSFKVKAVVTKPVSQEEAGSQSSDSKPIKCIGLVLSRDEIGDVVYQNIEFEIKGKEVLNVKPLEKTYAINDAINHATYWIDREYWRKDMGQ